MKDASFRLSRRQVTLLVFLVTICVTPFTYDSVMLLYLGRWAWAGLVPALAVGLLGCAVAGSLAARFPGRSIIGYAPEVLGPTAGRIFLLAVGLMLLAGAPGNLHVFVRVVRFTELPHTSPYLVSGLFIAVVAYLCYGGPEVIARAAEVLAPLVLGGLLIIFLAPLLTAVPERLATLGPFPWSGYWLPSVASTLGSARGFLFLLVVGGRIRDGEDLRGPAMAATVAAWVLLALSLALPIAVLGSTFAADLRYPILGVTGTVTFRWLPFQRITIVTILIWQMIMYTVLAFYLWSGVLLVCAAIGIRDWRPWLLAGGALTAYVSGVPHSPTVSRNLIDAWNFAVVAAGILLPAPLLLLHRRTGRASL